MVTKIKNGLLVLPECIKDVPIYVCGDKIMQIGGDIAYDAEINAQWGYITPGFIDLHLHGGGGYDFIDGTPEAYREISRFHMSRGTTTMTPTLLSASPDEVECSLEAYNSVSNDKSLGFAGIHMEGPYFAYSQRGAQDPRYFLGLEQHHYERWYAVCSDIIRWSVAPELDGMEHLAHFCCDRGILLSLAHSEALYDDVVRARELGFSMFTHLYSGMTGVTRINAFRHGGAVEAALLMDDMYTEIIADGCHLPPELIRLVVKNKGTAMNALVTDAMRAAGQMEGEAVLGSLQNGQRVIIEDGVAKLPDRTAFAGSIASADRLLATAIGAGIDLCSAVRMMTSTPAKILGRNDIGELAEGKMADLVIFDKDIKIKSVMKNGKLYR